ncbi:MAG: GTPase [Gemmataceae bacterium]
MLFSTLDTRTRQWHIPDWGKVLLSDTVGFIRDLPHHLIASFKATLEEARQARLLLHVVDASNPHAEEHITAVKSVLQELGCADRPTLLVLNKVDRVEDPSVLHVLQKHHPHAVSISAGKKLHLDELRNAVVEMLSADYVDVRVELDAADGKLISYLGAHADVHRQETRDSHVIMYAWISRHLLKTLQESEAKVEIVRDPTTLNVSGKPEAENADA